MPTISVVIVTKNEERNIKRCLESLKEIPNEVIVIDSFSQDRTKEICQVFGQNVNVRFEQIQWKGFSETKNYGIGLAQFDYILSLDADEALGEELYQNLLSLKADLFGAYTFCRKTNYCGQWISHCGWYPDIKLRLFPRGQGHWNNKTVHEDLALTPPLTVELIKGDLLHYSYYSIKDHLQRTHKYSDLAAQSLAQSNRSFLRTRAIVHGFFKLLKSYFLQLGFMDGFYGLCICCLASYEVFLKYSKAYQLRKRSPKIPSRDESELDGASKEPVKGSPLRR